MNTLYKAYERAHMIPGTPQTNTVGAGNVVVVTLSRLSLSINSDSSFVVDEYDDSLLLLRLLSIDEFAELIDSHTPSLARLEYSDSLSIV